MVHNRKACNTVIVFVSKSNAGSFRIMHTDVKNMLTANRETQDQCCGPVGFVPDTDPTFWDIPDLDPNPSLKLSQKNNIVRVIGLQECYTSFIESFSEKFVYNERRIRSLSSIR
jgi:hypothetical protein